VLITEDVIREALWEYDYEIRQAERWGWVLKFSSGRVVNIYPSHVDLCGITRAQPGDTEEQLEELTYTLASIDLAVFGEVPLIGLRGIEYFKVLAFCCKYGAPGIDENQYRPFTKGHARHRFGDTAKVGRSWLSPGSKITVPGVGYAVVGMNARDEKTIEKVVGSPNVYAPAIQLLNDLQGFAIVRGSKNNIVRGVTAGNSLGIKVIPEYTRRFASTIGISWLCSTVFGWLGAYAGILVGHFEGGILAGLLTAFVIAATVDIVRTSGGVDGARVRGQKLLGGVYTNAGASSRSADLDHLRERGML